jgi:hypothetical protein
MVIYNLFSLQAPIEQQAPGSIGSRNSSIRASLVEIGSYSSIPPGSMYQQQLNTPPIAPHSAPAALHSENNNQHQYQRHLFSSYNQGRYAISGDSGVPSTHHSYSQHAPSSQHNVSACPSLTPMVSAPSSSNSTARRAVHRLMQPSQSAGPKRMHELEAALDEVTPLPSCCHAIDHA